MRDYFVIRDCFFRIHILSYLLINELYNYFIFRSRVRITESFRFHTAKDREFRLRESYLQISNISALSDQGPYKCQALNSVNNITSLTRLEIIGKRAQKYLFNIRVFLVI